MTVLYGINNCDTVKKAQKWLLNHNVNVEFHDFKKQGLSKELLEMFFSMIDWQILLNKRSTTFRNLPQETKDNLDESSIFNAMLELPTLIKRPVIINNDKIMVGFKDKEYSEFFNRG